MLPVPQHPFTHLIGHSLADPADTLAEQHCAVGSSSQQAHPPLPSRKQVPRLAPVARIVLGDRESELLP